MHDVRRFQAVAQAVEHAQLGDLDRLAGVHREIASQGIGTVGAVARRIVRSSGQLRDDFRQQLQRAVVDDGRTGIGTLAIERRASLRRAWSSRRRWPARPESSRAAKLLNDRDVIPVGVDLRSAGLHVERDQGTVSLEKIRQWKR